MMSPPANPANPPVHESIPVPDATSAAGMLSPRSATWISSTSGVTIRVMIMRTDWKTSTATTLMKPPMVA